MESKLNVSCRVHKSPALERVLNRMSVVYIKILIIFLRLRLDLSSGFPINIYVHLSSHSPLFACPSERTIWWRVKNYCYITIMYWFLSTGMVQSLEGDSLKSRQVLSHSTVDRYIDVCHRRVPLLSFNRWLFHERLYEIVLGLWEGGVGKRPLNDDQICTEGFEGSNWYETGSYSSLAFIVSVRLGE
jgi:hypothetical protein